MRPQSEALLMRRNISLSDQAMAQMANLRTCTWAGSDSEVLRQALLYFEQFVYDDQHGIQLVIRDKKGDDHPVSIDVLPEEAAPAERGGLVKRNLMLPEPSAERIDVLRSMIGATSDSEVLREAIWFYDHLVSSIVAGGKMVLKHPDGSEHVQNPIPVARIKPQLQKVRRGLARTLSAATV